MNGYFKNTPLAKVVYVNAMSFPYLKHDNGVRYMDTYMDSIVPCYVNSTFLTNLSAGDTIRVADTELYEELSGRIYEGVNSIDYIILENSIDLGEKQLVNVERVDEISGTHFTVYKNLDPAVIRLK